MINVLQKNGITSEASVLVSQSLEKQGLSKATRIDEEDKRFTFLSVSQLLSFLCWASRVKIIQCMLLYLLTS